MSRGWLLSCQACSSSAGLVLSWQLSCSLGFDSPDPPNSQSFVALPSPSINGQAVRAAPAPCAGGRAAPHHVRGQAVVQSPAPAQRGAATATHLRSGGAFHGPHTCCPGIPSAAVSRARCTCDGAGVAACARTQGVGGRRLQQHLQQRIGALAPAQPSSAQVLWKQR